MPLFVAFLAALAVFVLVDAIVGGAANPDDVHRETHARAWALLHPGRPMPPCDRCGTPRAS